MKHLILQILRLKTERGSSLLQVILLMGVLSIITASLVTSVVAAHKGQKGLSDKVEYIAAQSLIKDVISKDTECDCQVGGKVIDVTKPTSTVELSTIKASCAPGAPNLVKTKSVGGAATVEAERIYISNVTSAGYSNEYEGNLMVIPVPTPGQITVKPEPIPFIFHTDPASPNNAKVILGCGSAPLPAPTGLVATRSGSGCMFNWNLLTGTRPVTYTVRGGDTTMGNAPNGTKMCSATTNSCAISGLPLGATYYFAVQASNAASGTGPFSSEVGCSMFCSGNLNLPFPATNPCRKGRRTGTYSVNISNINIPENVEELFYTTGNIRVRKQANCGQVYCPLKVKCQAGILYFQTTGCVWGNPPVAGTLHSNLPNWYQNGGSSLNGWYNMKLYSQ